MVKIMGGSGHADYSGAHNPKYKQVDVPLKVATPDNIKEYGRIVQDYDKEEIWITTWPQQGWRPICQGTGNCAGIVTGSFLYKWEDEYLTASNKAVPDGDYVTGRLPQGVSPNDRTHVLVREANYHPDGGQLFFPRNSGPFIALLALPGDDVKPEDFVAFYFDGNAGLQIKANIWHQPLYPIDDVAAFDGKQGAVYACVVLDTVNEFNSFMSVPLKLEYAQ